MLLVLHVVLPVVHSKGSHVQVVLHLAECVCGPCVFVSSK